MKTIDGGRSALKQLGCDAEDAVHPIHEIHSVLRARGYSPESSSHMGSKEYDTRVRVNKYKDEKGNQATAMHFKGEGFRNGSKETPMAAINYGRYTKKPDQLDKQAHNAQYKRSPYEKYS